MQIPSGFWNNSFRRDATRQDLTSLAQRGSRCGGARTYGRSSSPRSRHGLSRAWRCPCDGTPACPSPSATLSPRRSARWGSAEGATRRWASRTATGAFRGSRKGGSRGAGTISPTTSGAPSAITSRCSRRRRWPPPRCRARCVESRGARGTPARSSSPSTSSTAPRSRSSCTASARSGPPASAWRTTPCVAPPRGGQKSARSSCGASPSRRWRECNSARISGRSRRSPTPRRRCCRAPRANASPRWTPPATGGYCRGGGSTTTSSRCA